MNVRSGNMRSREPRGMRWIPAVFGLFLFCGIVAWCLHGFRRAPVPVAQLRLADGPQSVTAPSSKTKSEDQRSPSPQPDRRIASSKATPYSRQLVAAVTRIDRATLPLTPEEVRQWKRSLDQLIQQGPDAAAGIAEFLQTNTDVVFGRAGRELLGFDSAREALFDALVRIGGPEATSATLQALQNSADPREIALLAQNLDTLAPDLHRQDALGAARDVLGMAADGKLPGYDVAPLFEVLQNYGGLEVVTDLEQASGTWGHYSAIALANLPEGAGIPSLILIAEQNGPAQTMALQLLAQLSVDYESAAAALTAQIRAESIPLQTWPFLVSALAGNQYFFQNTGFAGRDARTHAGNVSTAYVRSGNQTFYYACSAGQLNQEAINQRIALIDQLRAVTAQPATLQALNQAAEMLMKRLPKAATSR